MLGTPILRQEKINIFLQGAPVHDESQLKKIVETITTLWKYSTISPYVSFHNKYGMRCFQPVMVH